MTQRYADLDILNEVGLIRTEPHKLVDLQKGFRHLRDLPPDLLRLHRFCHL